MEQDCRHCKHAQVGSFDKNYKTQRWYCEVFKEMIPVFMLIINCPGFETNEPNLHDDNAARTSPQTRDQGIHQEK